MYEYKLGKAYKSYDEIIETFFLQDDAPNKGKRFANGECDSYDSFLYQKGPELHLGLCEVSYVTQITEDGEEIVKRKYQTRESVYNVETQELVSDLEDNDIARIGRVDVIEFCSAIIEANPYIMKAINKLNDEGFIANMKKQGMYKLDKATRLYRLCTDNQGLLESLIKENPIIFANEDAFAAVDIGEKGLKKAVGLPAAVMEFLIAKNYQNLMPYFQIICKDGNDAVILTDFIKNSRPLTKKRRDVRDMMKGVFENFSKIVEAESSYTATELIRYSLTQTMYHSMWGIDGLLKVTSMWKDWISVAKNFGVTERFPQNIFEAHDIMSRNTSGYTDEDGEKFECVSSALKYLEWEYTSNPGTVDEQKFVFIVPKTLQELIQEGVSLSHCIGTWGRKIINGDTRIVFMRYADSRTESLATLEIGEGGNVIQAKIKYNEDLPPELEAVSREYQSHLHRKHII